MIRGFIAGSFWGAILGLIALALTSQLADWRDLTPALADADITEEQVPVVPPDPSDGAQDAPVVTAGTGSFRPEAADQPASATETAPEISTPALETATAQAPSSLALPETAPAPATPTDATGSVDVVAIAAPPGLRASGDKASAAPIADTPPAATDTLTAPVPARLAPEAQTGIAGLSRPDASGVSPSAPSASVSDGPSVVPQSAGLVPVPDSVGEAPALPSQPSQPAPATTPVEAPVVAGADDVAPELGATPDVARAVTEAPAPPAASLGDGAAVEVAEVALPPAPQTEPALPQPDVAETVELAELQPDEAPSASAAPAAPAAATVDTGQRAASETPEAPTIGAPEAPANPDVEVASLDIPKTADTSEEAPRAVVPVQVAQVDQDAAPDKASPLPERASPERAIPRVTRIGAEGGATGLPGVRIRRLPSIGDDQAEDVQPDAPDTATTDAGDPDAPALIRNAIAFDPAADTALLSIVLVHEPGGAIEALPVPMTFAVPASATDAADTARSYREAGHEIALIPDLPAGARAQDVEVALQVNLADVPSAVALIDPTGDGFQANQAAVAQIVAAASGTGHGVVTRAQGLDSAGRFAARDGVAAARIFAVLDPAQTDRAAIARALDRAAFRARSDGRLILAASAQPELVAGILAWALENRDGDVALAPLSAVLQSPAE